MLFEIEKPRLLYFKQHFSTSKVILQQPREQVLYFYSSMYGNKIELIVFSLQRNELGQSVMSFLINKTSEKAVPCCTLMIVGMQMISFQVTRVTQVTYCYWLAFVLMRRASCVNIFFSRTPWPILTKFGMQHLQGNCKFHAPIAKGGNFGV